MTVNFGSKRMVVGAHYGLRDWLAQRVSAALMALFTAVLLFQLLRVSGPIGYDAWASIFSAQWMKILTFVAIVSMLFHAWVGARDIFMDYVKSAALRLCLQIAALAWLVGCTGWAVQMLWRL